MTESIDKEYEKIVPILGKGGAAMPVSDKLIALLKMNIPVDNLDFLLAFKRKAGQTMEDAEKYLKKAAAYIK